MAKRRSNRRNTRKSAKSRNKKITSYTMSRGGIRL